MKKFLLSLATVALAATSMSAETKTVSLDFVGDGTSDLYGMTRLSGTTSEYNANPTTVTSDGVKIVLEGNTRLWKDGLRFYKDSRLTISADGYNVTAVEFDKNYAKFNYDGTALTTAKWTGSAESVKFDCNITKSNAAIGKLTITLESTLTGDQKPAGLSFDKSVVYGVEGEQFLQEIPVLDNPNNLPVTWSSSDEAVATVTDYGDGFVMVQLTGKLGTAVISVHSDATDEFGEGNASYTINVVTAANNVAEMLSKAPNKNDKILVNCALTVLYANGNYVYVTDERDGYTLLWQPTHEYKAGDIIRGGWEATNSTYNGLVEFTGNFPASAGNFPVEYAITESVSLEDVNKVLYINNVTFAEATPVFDDANKTKTNFTGTLADGTEVTFRTNWNIESVVAGKYKVLSAVSVFNGNLQIFPIAYEEPAVEVVVPEYPEHIAAACEGAEITYGTFSGMPETSVKATTSGENVTVTLTVPEGWTNILHAPVVAGGEDIEPLTIRRAEAAEWMSVSDMVNLGGMLLGNELTVPADGNEYEISCYLVLNDQVDMNNAYLVTVTAAGAAELVYPDYLTVECDAQMTTTNDNDFGMPNTTVNVTTASESATITVNIPEGWTAIWHSPLEHGDSGIGEAALRRAAAAEWITTAEWAQYGFKKANVFTIPANGEEQEIQCYLESDGKVDVANQYMLSVTVKKDTSSAVEEIEAADADAVYYDLQGNKVENPANGIYVKVANGKAAKVFVK